MTANSTFERACEEADWFLHRIDFEKSRCVFLRTSKQDLDAVAFHDGRSALSDSGESMTIPLDAALDWHRASPREMPHVRLLVHTSFCGSTLLARCLGDLPGVVSYREPQPLIEWSDWAQSRSTDTDLKTIYAFVLGQYTKTWCETDIAILKPSNWANDGMLSHLPADGRTRMVTLTMDARDFLIANLRGGRSRIGYTLDLLNRYSFSNAHYRDAVSSIQRGSLTPLRQALRLVGLCHHVQQRTLRVASENLGAEHTKALTRHDVVHAAADSVLSSAQLFGIATSDAHVAAVVADRYSRNAKDGAAGAWTPSSEQLENQRLVAEFDADLDDTLDWYGKELLHPA